jgi:6-phosphofructokinase 1
LKEGNLFLIYKEDKMKKIAILTSGGDAPGMNAVIKAVVNASFNAGMKPYIVYEGFKGLVEGNFKEVSKKMVMDIETKSGTIIYSARYPEFKDETVRLDAVHKMNEEKIDYLVVIGGDGSYMGAARLSEMGIKTIGIPGTIDNDIPNTDYTIGFLSALETITDSINQIRATSESHKRANVVEVMGRYAGDLAINAAIATGAEILSTPELFLTKDEIIKQVKKAREEGNRSIIILVTEHLYNVDELAKEIEEVTSVETRATILGHTQRGGKPVASDIILANKMGLYAVKVLNEGVTSVAVGIRDNKLMVDDINKVINMKRSNNNELIKTYKGTK